MEPTSNSITFENKTTNSQSLVNVSTSGKTKYNRLICIEACIVLIVIFVTALIALSIIIWLGSLDKAFWSKTPPEHEKVYLNAHGEKFS